MRQSSHVRERTEELERSSLSVWGTLASETKGRDRYEEPDPLRTPFQQDRERILTSQAFLRLAGKTHMLIPSGAVARTRLLHTLQVVSTARALARAMRVNEDLAECIALGHAVGQPPYGAAGQRAIAAVTDVPFHPGEHALRRVERYEDHGRGLNLTWEVRDGLLHACESAGDPTTIEGRLVRVAVRMEVGVGAVSDLLAAGLARRADLPPELAEAGSAPLAWREALVAAVAQETGDRPEMRVPGWVEEALDAADRLAVAALSSSPAARAEHDRAEHCLRSLLIFYLHDPTALPQERARQSSESTADRVLAFVVDMTDADARTDFTRRFTPGHRRS